MKVIFFLALLFNLVGCSGAISSDGLEEGECIEGEYVLDNCDPIELFKSTSIFEYSYLSDEDLQIVCVANANQDVFLTRDRLQPMPVGYTSIKYRDAICADSPVVNKDSIGDRLYLGLILTSELDGI